MNPIFAAALALQEFCQDRSWRFAFIGALAGQRWGEPRLTLDVDWTILTGFGSEEDWIRPLLEAFTGRRDDAEAFALETRVVLLRAANGVPLDVSLGGHAVRGTGRGTRHPLSVRP